jgi:hypothetical protein
MSNQTIPPIIAGNRIYTEINPRTVICPTVFSYVSYLSRPSFYF